MIQVTADHDGQHRVTEKFQSLITEQVVVFLPRFVGVRGVGHGPQEQVAVAETIANGGLQGIQRGLVGGCQMLGGAHASSPPADVAARCASTSAITPDSAKRMA